MATKQVEMAGLGTVYLYKRRGTRRIRLSVNSMGKIRVTVPYWTPYQAGVSFARSHTEWLIKEKTRHETHLVDVQPVGKSHRLHFITDPACEQISTRVKDSEILVTMPTDVKVSDNQAQEAAQKACVRVLRREAENLLPDRLAQLARDKGLRYNSVVIRQLRSRWGSCNDKMDIKLSLYLMQLPWPMIDYVLLHELAHTKAMHHGSDFWIEMERILPGAKRVRRQMRDHRPTLFSINH